LEEEIDLRPYIEAVVKNWKWVVGAAVIAGVTAFIVSLLLRPNYEATALAAVTEPGAVVEFDPRIRSVDDGQPLKAYPEIALSDELMLLLLAEIKETTPDITSIEDLRKMLDASAGADDSLLRLTVTYHDPEQTAGIANRWAELFVTRVNEIYGNTGGDQLAFFEAQLADAETELTATEQALIEFQARNRAVILGNRLDALQQAQANQLEKQQQIASILQDTTSLLEQLEQGEAAEAGYSDQLTALLLQVRAFGGSGDGENTAVPWQIQVDTSQLERVGREEQIAGLTGLHAALVAQLAGINAALEELEPQILEIQQQKQEVDTEASRLTRTQTVAEETYTALARKVEEERITSQDTGSGVKLVGRTAVPEEPVSPRKLINAIVAGMLGGGLAIIVILFRQW
jgi:uncharacterized protein involved in exopolysaccharide biosynthesis